MLVMLSARMDFDVEGSFASMVAEQALELFLLLALILYVVGQGLFGRVPFGAIGAMEPCNEINALLNFLALPAG